MVEYNMVYPANRWVNEEYIRMMYSDAVANGEVEYYSKKTSKYVPVRAKHEGSIFWEVKTDLGVEYVLENELERLSGNL